MKIVILGDSVTEGCFELFPTEKGFDTVRDKEACYASILQRRFRELHPEKDVEIINAGISGNSAEDGLRRLERDVLSKEPDAAVVCFGLNSAVTPEQFAATMGEIFRKLTERGIRTVFMTPNMMSTYVPADMPDYLVNAAGACTKRQVNGDMDRRMEAGIRAAEQYGVTVCDAYGVWKKWASYGIDTTELLSNQINHPKRETHRMFADLLYPVLERFLQESGE
ncbi:MAG: hypothetical protein IK088_03670 [Lachnospiraceae bacterium]|nr:hypothetical protein [Lachnospiraceae bacterium]